MSDIQTVTEHCKHPDCIYRNHINLDGLIGFCDYISLTGHSRGCSISECTKYRRGKKTKRNHNGIVIWNIKYEEDGK